MKSKTVNSQQSTHHGNRFSLRNIGHILIVLVLMACSGGTILHEYHDVDLWGWDATDTVSFVLPTITASGHVVATIGVRFTNSYPYNDLFLLGTLERDSTVVRKDTIKVSIYNEKGNNEGEGFPYATITQPIVSIEVDSGYAYEYKVNHMMQDPQIKGITSVGLHLKSN